MGADPPSTQGAGAGTGAGTECSRCGGAHWPWPLSSDDAARDTLLLVLAFTSGYIDAVSYLGLGQVFTSNMTGNTVVLGMALGQAKGFSVERAAIAIAGFLVGVIIASAVIERRPRHPVWPSTVTAALGIEAVVLLFFAAGGWLSPLNPSSGAVYGLIALSAIAMGFQSVTVRSLGVSGVTTTYVSGTWTSFAAGLTRRLRADVDDDEANDSMAPPSSSVALQAAVLAVYIAAAVAGAIAALRWSLRANLLPVAAVTLVLVVAFFRFRRHE